jgi:Protein of unknown function (DUF2800)
MTDTLPVHSPYGASGAHRWTACPGSVRLTAPLEEEPSSYAQEGTACHTVSAACLTNGQDAVEWVGRFVDGIEIDEEHAVAIQLYLDTIRTDQARDGGELLIEQRFHLKDFDENLYGTADCVRIGRNNLVAVYDAKFGAGEIVEVVRPDGRPNIQLGFYGLGAVYELRRSITQFGTTRVELVVVQPRAWHRDGPIRRKIFNLVDIEAIGDELVDGMKKCLRPNAPLIAGSHCKFCKAAGTCPELRAYTLKAASLEFSESAEMELMGDVPDPATMTPQQIANVLYSADIFETWLNAVRARAHVMAEHQGVPGWKLVQKQARRKWTDEEKASNALVYDFGLDEDLIFETKMKSPAQVEKLLSPKDRKTEEFAGLCPAVSSGLTLVRDTNPRLEIVPLKVTYDDGTSTAEGTEW